MKKSVVQHREFGTPQRRTWNIPFTYFGTATVLKSPGECAQISWKSMVEISQQVTGPTLIGLFVGLPTGRFRCCHQLHVFEEG